MEAGKLNTERGRERDRERERGRERDREIVREKAPLLRSADTLISISEIFGLASVRVPATSPGQSYSYYIVFSMLCFYDPYTPHSAHTLSCWFVCFLVSSIGFLFVARRRRALVGCCVRYSRCISSIHAKNFTEFSRCMNEWLRIRIRMRTHKRVPWAVERAVRCGATIVVTILPFQGLRDLSHTHGTGSGSLGAESHSSLGASKFWRSAANRVRTVHRQLLS